MEALVVCTVNIPLVLTIRKRRIHRGTIMPSFNMSKFTLITFTLFFNLTCDAFVHATRQNMASGNRLGIHHDVSNNMNVFVPASSSLFRGGTMGATPTTTTSLSMVGNGNLFDRFARVMKSNINKFVSSIENPEKVIVQAVDDMQSDLIRVRQAYAEATAGQRRLQRQKEQADAVASDWYSRAQLALQRGNEGLAREALARRQLEVDRAAGIQLQMDTQGAAVAKLYAAMNALEVKIREAASKKEQLVARARTAKSTAQVNDMLSGLTGKTSMDAFTRMEQKVEALEAAAEVSAEMSFVSGSTTKDSVEMEFRLLEQSSKVDDELQKMKGTLNLLGAASIENRNPERVSIPVGRGETIYIPVNRSDR